MQTSAEVTASVLDPRGEPPNIEVKVHAPRLESLEGKTLFLVDCRFDDSVKLLQQIAIWLKEHVPHLTTHLVQLAGYYGDDDPVLWARIKAEGHCAILGVGHCSTCAPAVVAHAITLEIKYGIPAVSIHTATFERVVRAVKRIKGLSAAPVVYVPQPVMGKTTEELRAYVRGADPITGRPVMQEVLDALTFEPVHNGGDEAIVRRASRLLPPDSTERLHELFLRNQWTDRLPIVLPTERRVQDMLAHTKRAPQEICGRMQPTANRGLHSYTVEKVAVNAVMAGARPEYFPVILALASSGISARGSTSSSSAAMVVVNGPIRDEIEMNCGTGAMGPYNHANATIGRAYGLLSQNLQGGSVVGETFMGSLGNNYSYNSVTFAENEARSPWEPLHVQKGFAVTDSAVSIFTGCRSTTFCLGLRETYWREHIRDMLLGIDVVAAPVLLLDPIAARQFIERGGFDSKGKLIRWIHETARMPAGRYWDLQLVQNYIYPRATAGIEPYASKLKARAEELIALFEEPQINVVVLGGETNGYWQIMGARFEKTAAVDAWR